MSPRRVSLPAADDLFRRTDGQPGPPPVRAVPTPEPEPRSSGQSSGQPTGRTSGQSSGQSSGRVRHDEKVTVYLTAGELLDLEHARLTLRSDHGIAVDRGRLVREAIAVVLADLQSRGADSVLVDRLARD